MQTHEPKCASIHPSTVKGQFFTFNLEKNYTRQNKFTQAPPVVPVTNMRFVSADLRMIIPAQFLLWESKIQGRGSTKLRISEFTQNFWVFGFNGRIWQKFWIFFFGPFWVIFGPFWIILGHFCVIMGHFGSFWIILGHFGPFWVFLGHFGSF